MGKHIPRDDYAIIRCLRRVLERLECLLLAHRDRPPFLGRPSTTGHCGQGWTCSPTRFACARPPSPKTAEDGEGQNHARRTHRESRPPHHCGGELLDRGGADLL